MAQDDEPDVQLVNVTARLAMLTDGSFVPIVALFDSDGDVTEDPEAARSAYCGPDPTGKWFAFDLRAFAKQRTH